MQHEREVQAVKDYLLRLQLGLRQSLQTFERKPFLIDEWQRPQKTAGIAGQGITCVLQQGDVFDSAGVNFSHVTGDDMPKAATAHRPHLAGRRFEAMGISSVIHPVNPFAPTCHLNVRLFVATKPGEDSIWWFGGGFDLTPYFGFDEDAAYWHQVAYQATRPFGDAVYAKYKAWADSYFYLPHRQEPRGIGGLFFDDLDASTFGWSFQRCFEFLQSVGENFWTAYGPILHRRIQMPFSQNERAFQRYRRGRYVEFNLVYDRGTLFGLQSGGRTPSILMSLPTEVHWAYAPAQEHIAWEAELLQFMQPRNWVEDVATEHTHRHCECADA